MAYFKNWFKNLSLPHDTNKKGKPLRYRSQRGQALVETVIVITMFVTLAILSHHTSVKAKKQIQQSYQRTH